MEPSYFWKADGGEHGLGRTLFDIATNRLLPAIGGGVIWNLNGLEFHDGIALFLQMAGVSATATALFALGVILSTADLTRPGPPVWAATGVRMVLHPGIALLLLGLFGPISPVWYDASGLAFAAPGGAMAFVLGLRYNVDVDIIIRVILVSTALSGISFALLA